MYAVNVVRFIGHLLRRRRSCRGYTYLQYTCMYIFRLAVVYYITCVYSRYIVYKVHCSWYIYIFYIQHLYIYSMECQPLRQICEDLKCQMANCISFTQTRILYNMCYIFYIYRCVYTHCICLRAVLDIITKAILLFRINIYSPTQGIIVLIILLFYSTMYYYYRTEDVDDLFSYSDYRKKKKMFR